MNALNLPNNFANSLRLIAGGDSDDSQESIWQPSPENAPQCMAYELARSGAVHEIGYGGQAGGGKTDLALGLAGTVFKQSLILRREYPQLHDIEMRGDEIYPVDFVGGSKKRWQFDGREIGIASCQYEKDWKKYQGRSISLLMFDEAAEFLENQVQSISGWIRSPLGEHTLLLLCFNPPTTPEGEWIVQKFAPWIAPDYAGTRAEAGEIRWFIRGKDEKEIEVESGEPVEINGRISYPISRTFISASRHDNPYLGEDYERRLDNLPEPLRTMVMDGDFTLSVQDDRWQVIPTNWILAAQERHRDGTKPAIGLRSVGVDVARGGKDKTAIAKLYETWFDDIIVYPGSETPDGTIAAHFVIQAMETMSAPIFVDALPTSCSDVLDRMQGVNSTAVNFGSGSNATDESGVYHFANLRAQMFWQLREALNPKSGENIALPDDRDLRVELSSMRYKIVSGRIQIESKEDIIKRLGRSPDLADAVALAWHGTMIGGTGWGDAPY